MTNDQWQKPDYTWYDSDPDPFVYEECGCCAEVGHLCEKHQQEQDEYEEDRRLA